MELDEKTKLIQTLNDRLRKTFLGGQIMVTTGVQALDELDQRRVMQAVSDFNGFNPDNDPYEEHDCATLTVNGHKVMFKIDYYALDMLHGSEEPSDESQTKRVLTIMLAEEY